MTFSEKLKAARKQAGLSQRQLAEEAQVSLRTITGYENGECVPKQEATYGKLARALGITEESLKDENSDFMLEARKHYGGRGWKQAEEVVRAFRVAAAGGELDDDDLEFIREAMMQTYWDAKRYNQRFGNKRFRQDDGAAEDKEEE